MEARTAIDSEVLRCAELPRHTRNDAVGCTGCTFADDFDGSELDRTKWLAQTYFITGDENGAHACYHDDPDNVSVSNGALQLTVRREPEAEPCDHRDLAPSRFTGGGVSTYHLFSQRYGRFEARFKNKATTSPGLQEAFGCGPRTGRTSR